MNQIDFNLWCNDGTFISGTDLLKDVQAHKEKMSDRRSPGGSISIVSGNSICTIEDELAPLLCNFCLNTLPELLQQGKAHYRFFEVYGEVQLQMTDDIVCISGDFISEILMHKIDFVPLSLQCALHYIAFLKQIDEPRYNNDVQLLSAAYYKTMNYLSANHPELLLSLEL